ncbi:MAG: LolA-like protein [Thermoleophilia bacterium]
MKRRDEQLGAALRDLDVPDHAPGFFQRLELEFDAADGSRRSTTSWRRPLTWGLAAAAVAAAVLIAVMVAPRGLLPDRVADDLGPGIATAAEIKAKVTAAVQRVQSLRGLLVVISRDHTDAPQDEMRWHFAATARGDFALRGSNVLQNGVIRAEELAYDAATGVERAWSRDGDEQPFGGERVGLAAGPPDPGPSEWVLQRSLGGVVRALLAADTPSVRETAYEGRPAWVLGMPVDQNRLSTYSADRMEVTVDQATGFPVRVVETLKGGLVREIRLEDLELDPILADDAFTVVFPPNMDVTPLDQGFRRVSAADASATAAYQPPLPAAVPEGFELTLVTVAEQSTGTGKEGMNPAARGVVSVSYRRGFDNLVISSRLTGDDAGLWSDPLAGGEGFVDRPESVTLQAGAFAGETAEVLIDPRSQMPHLWVTDETLVVTVAGDLTRAELIAVAESLMAGPAAD